DDVAPVDKLRLKSGKKMRSGANKQSGIALGKCLACRNHRFTPPPAVQGGMRGHGGRQDTWNALYFPDERRICLGAAVLELCKQHALAAESRIEGLKILERSYEQSRPAEEHERQRDLADHQER